MKIKTINGGFDFLVNRYQTSQGFSNWLRLTDKELSRHYESEKLREFSLRYGTMLSYERVSGLVGERCGTSRLSDQRLYHLVQEEAEKLRVEQERIIRAREARKVAVKAISVDIYEAKAEEIIWLSDGICVSEQKIKRDGQAKRGKERTTTEMAMMQRKDGSYKTLIAGKEVEKLKLYEAEVVKEYGGRAGHLPLVAISDGARSLKNETKKLFGKDVCHILDWYHLEAKVYQLMTQIARSKEAKKESTEILLAALWQGETARAIGHLQEIKVKNEVKQNELIGYLEKNQGYIINYQRRTEAKKIIGSGRMEKQNDVLVAHRQKRKGMSWSKNGSLSLALVTAHFNQRTNYLQ